MYRFAWVIGNIIVILGVVTLLIGTVLILGLGSLFSGIRSGSAAIRPILTTATLIAGSPVVLGSFLIMGFGSLVMLVSDIAEKIK